MRPGSNVTVIFEDGSRITGQLVNHELHPPETMDLNAVGGVMQSVVTRPGSMVLEVFARELTPPPTPVRRRLHPSVAPVPMPVSEAEEAPHWGAYA